MASNVKFALCLAFMCMALLSVPISQAAIPCNQITASLLPCLGYLQYGGPVPTTCCNGVRSIAGAARSTADRQAACTCLKSAAGSFPRLNAQNIQALPHLCNVNLPYKISTSTNCASIK